MGSHPINLLFRFLLEIITLGITVLWAYRPGGGLFGFVLAVFVPLLLALVWGVFTVPDDPTRSGHAPVATPGPIRLFIELGIFAFATLMFYDLGYSVLCLVFGMLVLVHYAFSYDRIKWLFQR
jgi:multisubunit Na+/H+ antiporter MnhB subunit